MATNNNQLNKNNGWSNAWNSLTDSLSNLANNVTNSATNSSNKNNSSNTTTNKTNTTSTANKTNATSTANKATTTSTSNGWSNAWNSLANGLNKGNTTNNANTSNPSTTGGTSNNNSTSNNYYDSYNSGASYGGSSSGSSYSYNDGDITDRESLAAENQKELAKFNADTVLQQLDRQLANYDQADKQNRRLADVQRIQNSRRTEADRFEAMRDLQNASLGLFGSMNQAMNGSTVGNVMRMLENRNDKDNMTYWNQLQQNQNAVENAYDESMNQNALARNEAISSAEATLRGMEGDLAANLNNINPNLYVAPGTASGEGESGSEGINLGSQGLYDARRIAANNARLSGYLMPDNSVNTARNIGSRAQLNNNSYFNRLINGFNYRR